MPDLEQELCHLLLSYIFAIRVSFEKDMKEKQKCNWHNNADSTNRNCCLIEYVAIVRVHYATLSIRNFIIAASCS